ncbi:TIGR02678 family protein [Streptomyces sp. CB02923]|uniref:TIGR02678 family protein n=1 Tax=Streptomyces sp. CB02923 TaxID=1718985 RepID=UPI00093FC774|nr:TIGR02678 family protein [Streptomyces sp. CB02923]OKI02243.1 TIGR02678 family protein [Streptomyces sp. CB02923]
MSTLANQLAAVEREEVARGIRFLLARPLLTEAADPAAFDLVRRRHEPLEQWFDYTCGWNLVVEPRRGYARLAKVRADPDGSRPARRPRAGRAPFDRRRYVLLCVTAAELLSMPMTTIGLLADRVVQATAADRALSAFDPVHRPERTAFVDVLKLLESYGVLRAVDGATDAYIESAEAKVLYRVDSTLLIRLPSAPVGASRLAVPPEEAPARFEDLLAGLVRERRYGHVPEAAGGGAADEARSETGATDTQRNLHLRHSVLRRLFDDPVLYRADLSEEELAYVTSLTGRQILRRSVEQAGFVLEERAEGFLLVDPDALATDFRFPDDTSTARVAALLLLDSVCAAPAGKLPEQLAEAGADLLRRFPRWAKAYRSEDGAARLADDAVRVLCDVGLVRRDGGRVIARPAAHRYRVAEAASAGTDSESGGQRSATRAGTTGAAASGGAAEEGDEQ